MQIEYILRIILKNVGKFVIPSSAAANKIKCKIYEHTRGLFARNTRRINARTCCPIYTPEICAYFYEKISSRGNAFCILVCFVSVIQRCCKFAVTLFPNSRAAELFRLSREDNIVNAADTRRRRSSRVLFVASSSPYTRYNVLRFLVHKIIILARQSRASN